MLQKFQKTDPLAQAYRFLKDGLVAELFRETFKGGLFLQHKSIVSLGSAYKQNNNFKNIHCLMGNLINYYMKDGFYAKSDFSVILAFITK